MKWKLNRTPRGGTRLHIEIAPEEAALDEAVGTFNGQPLLPAKDLTISEAGLTFLKHHEGTRKDAAGRHVLYDNDGGGHCTIGFGHLVHKGLCTGAPSEEPYVDGLDDAAAHTLFLADIAPRVGEVREFLGSACVTQPMFDAVLSLHFNVGTHGGWRLYQALKAGDYARAATEFDVVTSNGCVVRGLVRRRLAEVRVFLGGYWSSGSKSASRRGNRR